MTEPRTLDVGCGSRKTPGAIGMDVLADSAADVIGDLNARWPFEDSSFERVVANHVIEHVPDVVHVIDEAWRVLVPGGTLSIRGPHFSAAHIVWSDPTHRRGLSIAMFQHFQPGCGHPYGRGRFQVRNARLLTTAADDGGGSWRRLARPLLKLYEDQANKSALAHQRAERLWSRVLPFHEVVIELVSVEK